MPDPASRRAALIAAAMLVGPSIPPALTANRPQEAATALTRMADLLLPWLEDEPAPPGTTRTAAAATEAGRTPETEGHARPVDPRDHPAAV